jgi:hypothetical protein
MGQVLPKPRAELLDQLIHRGFSAEGSTQVSAQSLV